MSAARKREREEGHGDDSGEESAKEVSSFRPEVVLPGQDVSHTLAAVAPDRVRIGAGLIQDGDSVIASHAGMLRWKSPDRFWVESSGRRYIPAVGDTVIGTVTAKGAEEYRLDMGASAMGLLPVLAFDGASKRNKPNLAVGALVYARIASADRHLDPELSCQVTTGPKKDWVTGESLFGELREGTVVSCSLAWCRSLLDPATPVLRALAKSIPFEMAVGLNGRVWIRAGSTDNVVLVSNAIQNAEFLTPPQQRAMVRRLLTAAARS